MAKWHCLGCDEIYEAERPGHRFRCQGASQVMVGAHRQPGKRSNRPMARKSP